MARALAHRGPDDHGIEVAGQVGLVHTRLSIVDPSPAGHQPMGLDGGRWWLTYNGEVFNHLELRDELGWPGVARRVGHRDAPPRARCVGRRRAGALQWPVRVRRVRLRRAAACCSRATASGSSRSICARHGGALWFASRGRRAAGRRGRGRRPARRARARRRVRLGGRGADAVRGNRPPGCPGRCSTSTSKPWPPPSAAGTTRRPRSTAERHGGARRRRPRRAGSTCSRRSCAASVRRRLMADVPVGTMCSGGLDSSLITALAREEHPGSSPTTPR